MGSGYTRGTRPGPGMPYAPCTLAPQGATASGSSLARAPRVRRTGARCSTLSGRSSSTSDAWRACCPPRYKRPASSGDCTTRLSWRALPACSNAPSWERHSSRPLAHGAGTAGCGGRLRGCGHAALTGSGHAAHSPQWEAEAEAREAHASANVAGLRGVWHPGAACFVLGALIECKHNAHVRCSTPVFWLCFWCLPLPLLIPCPLPLACNPNAPRRQPCAPKAATLCTPGTSSARCSSCSLPSAAGHTR